MIPVSSRDWTETTITVHIWAVKLPLGSDDFHSPPAQMGFELGDLEFICQFSESLY